MSIVARYRPYYKRLLGLALPVVVAQVGQLTTQFADTAMVGNYGGTNPVPLAAVSIGSSLFLLVYLAALGLSLAITPIVGECYAQGDSRGVGRLFQNGMLYSVVTGIVATAAALMLRPLIGKFGEWMSSPGQDVTAVVEMAVPYYDMLVWSLVPMMLFLAVKQWLEGIGNTRTTMWVTLFGNALNIGLNYLFIFGHCGFDAMGAEGAGLATLISRVGQTFIMLGYFLLARNIRIYRVAMSFGAFSRATLLRLLKVGYPISFQMVLESAAFILTSILALSFGEVAAGSMQVAFSIANIAWMITVALGSASTIALSHIYGSSSRRELRPMVMATYHLGLVWALAMALFFVVGRVAIADMFTDNAAIVALTSELMLLIAVYQFSDAVQGLSISMMRGLQDVKIIMPIVLCSYLGLNIPVGMLLAYHFELGCHGLVIGLIVGLTAAALLTLFRLRRTVRRLSYL